MLAPDVVVLMFTLSPVPTTEMVGLATAVNRRAVVSEVIMLVSVVIAKIVSPTVTAGGVVLT